MSRKLSKSTYLVIALIGLSLIAITLTKLESESEDVLITSYSFATFDEPPSEIVELIQMVKEKADLFTDEDNGLEYTVSSVSVSKITVGPKYAGQFQQPYRIVYFRRLENSMLQTRFCKLSYHPNASGQLGTIMIMVDDASGCPLRPIRHLQFTKLSDERMFDVSARAATDLIQAHLTTTLTSNIPAYQEKGGPGHKVTKFFEARSMPDAMTTFVQALITDSGLSIEEKHTLQLHPQHIFARQVEFSDKASGVFADGISITAFKEHGSIDADSFWVRFMTNESGEFNGRIELGVERVSKCPAAYIIDARGSEFETNATTAFDRVKDLLRHTQY